MEELIKGAFADILKANRASLNAKFADAQRLRPALLPETFSAVLRQYVAPIVAAAEAFKPETARQVTLTLYDLALDLLGQGFLEPNSRHPELTRGWSELLPNIPQQVCAAPRLVTGSLTNALYNLSQVPDARPQQWLAGMLALAPLAPDPHIYLQAGQIAAWRCGLAHYRAGALDLCRSIPPALVRAALQLPADGNSDTADWVQRLAADPWLLPDRAGDRPRSLRIVKRVGAFRGFGGLFLQPPMVYANGEHFLVTDGAARWLLLADAFGAVFQRLDDLQPENTASVTVPFQIDQDGVVRCAGQQKQFDELAGFTSAACAAGTLAVTSYLSYAISLIALV
jgi:hypothetical protein